jgi:hypothetical protein
METRMRWEKNAKKRKIPEMKNPGEKNEFEMESSTSLHFRFLGQIRWNNNFLCTR